MASGPVAEAVISALGTEAGQWPVDVELYQPDKGTVLLNDAASCFGAQAILRICNLSYQLKYVHNTEFMSPTGQVPLLRAGKELVCGPQEIITYVNNKGFSVSEDFSDQDKAEMKAYLSLIDRSILPAELYMLWFKEKWVQRTKQQYGSQFPMPLNILLSYRKKWSIKDQLRALNWHLKKEEHVVEEFVKACQALAEKLGGHQFFISDRPTELDAMVFGHLHAILSRFQPDDTLVSIVMRHVNLQDFVRRMLKEYF